MGTTASTAVAPTTEDGEVTRIHASRRWPAPLFARANTLPSNLSVNSSLNMSRGSMRTSSAPRTSSINLPGGGGPRHDSIDLTAATRHSTQLGPTEDAAASGRANTDSRRDTAGRTERRPSVQSGIFGGMQRKLSNSKVLKQTTVVSELWKELSLVKRNIFSNKPWLDGLSVMWIVLSNTITSVFLAWLFTFIYAVGSPFAPVFSPTRTYNPRSPGSYNSLLFVTAIAAYFVSFACLSHTVSRCHTLAERLKSVHMTLRHGFRRTVTGYLWVAAPFMIAASLTGVGVMVVLDQLHMNYIRCGRIQLLILGLIVSLYVAFVQRHGRNLRRRMVNRMAIETVDGQTASVRSTRAPSVQEISAALDTSTAIVPSPGMAPFLRIATMTRIIQRTQSKSMVQRFVCGRHGFFLICITVMFGYVHLSLALRLQRQWEILLFAAFSLVIKIMIQEATKRIFLHASSKPSARTTHMIMTLPTVMVDAQIRMVFVQLGQGKSPSSSSSVLTSSFIIVICKICFRLVKILKLRATVKERLTHSKGMQRILKRVNSKIALRDIAIARAEYAQFLDWKNYMLRLHAAEVYADMHGEYISIGLAMAIVFFLTEHPMYALRQVNATVSSQMMGSLVQLATGLLFDYIASVVEGVHEVPLYEAIGDEGRGLRVYMHALLGAITVVNVGIVMVFLLDTSAHT